MRPSSICPQRPAASQPSGEWPKCSRRREGLAQPCRSTIAHPAPQPHRGAWPAQLPGSPTGFGGLLLASPCPGSGDASPHSCARLCWQISRFRQLTGLQHIRLDGHQHIHLIPLVLDAVLDYPVPRESPLCAPHATPAGRLIPKAVWCSLQTGGLLKWLVLQLLSGLAMPRLWRADFKPTGACRRVVQWINVRTVPPLLGNGLQLSFFLSTMLQRRLY